MGISIKKGVDKEARALLENRVGSPRLGSNWTKFGEQVDTPDEVLHGYN